MNKQQEELGKQIFKFNQALSEGGDLPFESKVFHQILEKQTKIGEEFQELAETNPEIVQMVKDYNYWIKRDPGREEDMKEKLQIQTLETYVTGDAQMSYSMQKSMAKSSVMYMEVLDYRVDTSWESAQLEEMAVHRREEIARLRKLAEYVGVDRYQGQTDAMAYINQVLRHGVPEKKGLIAAHEEVTDSEFIKKTFTEVCIGVLANYAIPFNHKNYTLILPDYYANGKTEEIWEHVRKDVWSPRVVVRHPKKEVVIAAIPKATSKEEFDTRKAEMLKNLG
jgi:hypothetical protein